MALIDELKNIGNAIRNKTGTTELIPLKNMASTIESISGGGTTGRREKTGTFTLDADAKTPTIEHNCGFTPSVFMVYPIEDYTIGNLMIIGSIIINDEHFNNLTTDKKPQFVWECQAYTTNWLNYSLAELTDTTVKLSYRSGNYIWKANFEYGWLAIE